MRVAEAGVSLAIPFLILFNILNILNIVVEGRERGSIELLSILYVVVKEREVIELLGILYVIVRKKRERKK